MSPAIRAKGAGKKAFINARLLDPVKQTDKTGGLLIEDDTIIKSGADVTEMSVPEGFEITDLNGACLAPGLVDMRAQLREPGFEHQETIETAGKSAAIGGVTTIIALPNTDPVIDDVAGVEFIARRARKVGLAKVFVYGAVSKGIEGREITEMGLLHQAGAVAFCDGVKTISSARLLRQALSYSAFFDGMIVQHPEEPELSKGASMNSGELATRLGLSGVSPLAEVIQIERDLRLVEMTGGRLHFAHISTGESVEVIRKAKKRGLKVTCDTAPPYFALNENAVSDYRTFAKLSPPLRSEDDRQAIVAGLADGTIDAIASDHNPQDADSKRLPFAQAAAGAVGFETLLPIALELYHNEHMSLLEVITKLTRTPAELLRFKGAGTLNEGTAADIVIFDPDRPWKIDPYQFHSKSKNSPFDGRLTQGRVLRTLIDGREIFTEGA
ncbi:dihydroorotase [Thalassospira australica]|uniref:dihydroorotase n=1 Tax=Thalassospira australica TaxID=1528106 RepID=UPI000519FEB5|nr:dihydroorotase [Thalassospira australica]